MNKNSVLDLPVRIVLLGLVTILYFLWGTSWEIPFTGLPPSYVWIALYLFIAVLLPGDSVTKEDALLILLLVTSFLFFSVIGLPQILNSDDVPRDLTYLLNYDIKIIIGGLSVFVVAKLIKTEKDFKILSLIACITLTVLTFFLYWKYIIVFESDFLGVVLSDPQKVGKNSLATAVALLAPFLFINFNKNPFYKFTSCLAAIALFILLFYIQSRSMIIICLIELMAFLYYVKKGSSRKIFISFLGFVLISAILSSYWLVSYVTKTGQFDDPTVFSSGAVYETDVVVESISVYFTTTHRAWLLKESISGFIENSGVGHGVATFRIRDGEPFCPPSIPCFPKSRTDTHNDYALILYEQGIIGIILLLYFFGYRIRKTKKIIYKSGHPMARASLASMYGLLVSLIFINLIQTLIFWIIVSLNILVVKRISEDSKNEISIQ